MAVRLLLLLALLALSTASAPTPGEAKQEDPSAVLVCGADRCAELRGRAVDEASAILVRPFFRRHGRALPFYDVLFVWRNSSGRPITGSALRWVPGAGATRTRGSRGPVWSRTDATLITVLSAATQGLRPRPPHELDDPVEALGAAAAAARRKLAETPVTALPSSTREPTEDGQPTALLIVLAGGVLVAIASAGALARRRRPDIRSSGTRRPKRHASATSERRREAVAPSKPRSPHGPATEPRTRRKRNACT